MKYPHTSFKNTEPRLPVLTISVATLSTLLYFCGRDAVLLLQYDRNMITNGELWRIITGHFTHWSFDHFLWCTITFIALGSICELLNRKGFILSLSASAIIIPVVTWLADPGMLFYRGLSGICSSIFIVGAILLSQRALTEKNRAGILLPAAGGILFFAKTVFEFINGQPLFVHTDDIFSPVPLAHLTGGTIGFITVACLPLRTQKPIP